MMLLVVEVKILPDTPCVAAFAVAYGSGIENQRSQKVSDIDSKSMIIHVE